MISSRHLRRFDMESRSSVGVFPASLTSSLPVLPEHPGPPQDKPYQRTFQRRYVEEAVEAILSGKPVPTSETKAIGCSVKYRQ